MLKRLALILTALSLVLVACGDDAEPKSNSATNVGTNNGGTNNGGTNNGGTNNGGTGGFSTGLEGTKTLGELTVAEVQTACDAVDAYANAEIPVEDQEQVSCVIGGIFTAAFSMPADDAEAQMICEAARDDCLADETMTEGSCQYEELSADCQATVAEAEACAEAQIALFKDLAANLTCMDASADPNNTPDVGQELPECDALSACQQTQM